MSLNTCTISGNLGKAAELRYTGTGLPWSRSRWPLTSGSASKTEAIKTKRIGLIARCSANEPKPCNRIWAKGTKLALVGHLHKSTYERDGQQRSRVEIIVDEVELMNTRRESQGTAQPQAMDAASVYDRDIPF